jgi:DNA-binding CsgD family transcriptional regulator
MIRAVVPWALFLAVSAFALQWLQSRYLLHAMPLELYVALVGVAFAIGGVWLGFRLSAHKAPAPFQRNAAAVASLGLTGQELHVLDRLAEGLSNKEIARRLGLSPNTVKTHLSNLFGKLEVRRRTEAISKARDLLLLP